MKKKGSVDLAKFVSIKPSVTVGGRDNLFALEIQGRTYIMQAANSSSKNVWLAKLYETLSGGEFTLVFTLCCVVFPTGGWRVVVLAAATGRTNTAMYQMFTLISAC